MNERRDPTTTPFERRLRRDAEGLRVRSSGSESMRDAVLARLSAEPAPTGSRALPVLAAAAAVLLALLAGRLFLGTSPAVPVEPVAPGEPGAPVALGAPGEGEPTSVAGASAEPAAAEVDALGSARRLLAAASTGAWERSGSALSDALDVALRREWRNVVRDVRLATDAVVGRLPLPAAATGDSVRSG